MLVLSMNFEFEFLISKMKLCHFPLDSEAGFLIFVAIFVSNLLL